jgi:hypothetical protein
MQVRSRAQGLGPCWFDERGSWDKKWARLRRTSPDNLDRMQQRPQTTTNKCQKRRNMQNKCQSNGFNQAESVQDWTLTLILILDLYKWI